ncbi:hypothetical protein Tco_0527296 [Tanacetum coccineum]
MFKIIESKSKFVKHELKQLFARVTVRTLHPSCFLMVLNLGYCFRAFALRQKEPAYAPAPDSCTRQIWEKLSLPVLLSTCMTLDCGSGSISNPMGIAKGHLVLKKAILNSEPPLPPPSQELISQKFRNELRVSTRNFVPKRFLWKEDYGTSGPTSKKSPWVSPIHCVPKKGGMTVVVNEENELIPTRLVTGWRVCIDYRKLNEATRKDHFPLPFMDQMLERLAGNEYYSFLVWFPPGYFQIPLTPVRDQKDYFLLPYGTFAYRFGMPFGFCNAPGQGFTMYVSNLSDMVLRRR